MSISDSVNETNPVIQAQNCEKRSQLEVNESVENTSGHSEQSTSVELGEEPEEREGKKTDTGINTIYICIIKMMITVCFTNFTKKSTGSK